MELQIGTCPEIGEMSPVELYPLFGLRRFMSEIGLTRLVRRKTGRPGSVSRVLQH